MILLEDHLPSHFVSKPSGVVERYTERNFSKREDEQDTYTINKQWNLETISRFHRLNAERKKYKSNSADIFKQMSGKSLTERVE